MTEHKPTEIIVPEALLEKVELLSSKESFNIGSVILRLKATELVQDNRALLLENIVLENQDGERFSISDLLPTDWQVVATGVYEEHADFLKKVIQLPLMIAKSNEYSIPNNQPLPEAALQIEDSVWGKKQFSRKVHPKTRVVNEFETMPYFDNPDSLLVLFHELGHLHHINLQNLPKDHDEREQYLLRKEQSQVLRQQEEYECWRYALSLIRHLEKLDFDFGEVFSEANIRQHIDWPLTSYGMNEYDLESLLAHYVNESKI